MNRCPCAWSLRARIRIKLCWHHASKCTRMYNCCCYGTATPNYICPTANTQMACFAYNTAVARGQRAAQLRRAGQLSLFVFFGGGSCQDPAIGGSSRSSRSLRNLQHESLRPAAHTHTHAQVHAFTRSRLAQLGERIEQERGSCRHWRTIWFRVPIGRLWRCCLTQGKFKEASFACVTGSEKLGTVVWRAV